MTRETSDMIFAGLDCVGKLQMWMVCCVQSVQQPRFDAQLPTIKAKQMAVQRRVVLLGRIGNARAGGGMNNEEQRWTKKGATRSRPPRNKKWQQIRLIMS